MYYDECNTKQKLLSFNELNISRNELLVYVAL